MAVLAGCGTSVFFNPAFLNTFVGGEYPVTPGPGAGFLFVRTINETAQSVEFVVTVERAVVQTDEEGNFRFEDLNNNGVRDPNEEFITESQLETTRLRTPAGGKASDLGVLFPCRTSLITRVGLGENLLPTDAAAFVGGEEAGGAAGFGIPATGLNPLRFVNPTNFNCGDTIIFRAVQTVGVAGGVSLQSLLLPGSEQPDRFNRANTFVNYEAFLESQIREDEP
jgi:hypothetical protein